MPLATLHYQFFGRVQLVVDDISDKEWIAYSDEHSIRRRTRRRSRMAALRQCSTRNVLTKILSMQDRHETLEALVHFQVAGMSK